MRSWWATTNPAVPRNVIRVRPGDNVAADGQIVSGEGSINQANITGESLPVDKKTGDQVFAGTINLTGVLEIKVTRAGTDSTLNRVRELIQDNAIGTLKEVHAWGNRQLPKPGYLPAEGKAPSHLHYDLWLGPSPYHPYNPGYFTEKAGMNCLAWNMYWDFGSGQVGDMGSHTMDLAWNALDADVPTHISAQGDPYNPEVTPVKLQFTSVVPANSWRPAVPVTWHQGGDMPKSPNAAIDINKIDHGAMFVGEKGVLLSRFDGRILIPNDEDGDLSYYHARANDKVLR